MLHLWFVRQFKILNELNIANINRYLKKLAEVNGWIIDVLGF